MTWTDAQGRPEWFMHPDIMRGTAAYRVVAGDDTNHDNEQQPRPPLVRRPPSPIRVAAAAKLAADARRTGEQPD